MGCPAVRFGAILFTIGIFLSLFSFRGICQAQIFKYVDKDGVIHFTNIPTLPTSQKLPAYPSYASNSRNNYTNYLKYNSSRSYLPSCNTVNLQALDPHIKQTCQRQGMDHNLVKAVIHAESAFNPQAVSPKGAMGLMQLMPDTSRDMGVANPFDPYQNIEGGTRYLRYLLNRFNNDYRLALAAYNAGPEAVEKYGGIPPYEETQVYVNRVLDLFTRYTR